MEDILTVDAGGHHQRLDVFLAKHWPAAASRSHVRKLIEDGAVRVNGEAATKVHRKIASGDEVRIVSERPEPVARELQAEPIPLDVFYEDDDLLVINKPAGLLVHPVQGRYSGTLVNALLHHCRTLADRNAEEIRPGIVHRLDRETSGLLVAAKNNMAHARLSKQFAQHKIHKRYVALVQGRLEFDEGVIDAPMGRHPQHWDKRAVSYAGMSKEAVTVYRVLRRLPEATLVALSPQSGRTHQLRVHMAHLGHTILGDDKYGKAGSFPRLALHAQALGFIHPKTRMFMEFSCVLPEEFTDFIHRPTQA